MEIDEIIKQLEYPPGGKLPMAALKEAAEKQREITPRLLQLLEDARRDIARIAADEDYEGHIYALYLLGYFREPRALPVIASLFSIPGEVALDITGDVLTDDLSRVLASVAHGDVGPIQALIESSDVNQYVRAAAIESLAIMTAHGEVTREWLVRYYGYLLEGGLEGGEAFVMSIVVASALDLMLTELRRPIQRAFDKGLVEERMVSRKDVEKEFSDRLADLHVDRTAGPRFSYIEEPMTEFASWPE